MSEDREDKVVSLNDYRHARDRWEIEAREENKRLESIRKDQKSIILFGPNFDDVPVDLSDVSIDKLMEDLRKTDLIDMQLADTGLSDEEKEQLTNTIMHMVNLIEESTREMVRDTLKDIDDNDTQGEE
tara:strand:- start:10 stop:393 length:384 start_codon:yes stop_codon:yes gene_type:complete